MILNRVGLAEKPHGRFFAVEEVNGVLQVRIDRGILPVWRDGAVAPVNAVFSYYFPSGSKVYIGEIGSQNGIFVGGRLQIVVPELNKVKGLKIINVRIIK